MAARLKGPLAVEGGLFIQNALPPLEDLEGNGIIQCFEFIISLNTSFSIPRKIVSLFSWVKCKIDFSLVIGFSFKSIAFK